MIDRSLMFSVLMSLKPQYCQRILDGVKTVEIRKTIPTLKPPFKVYMYCTKNKGSDDILKIGTGRKKNKGNGFVVGEFTCDGYTFDEAPYNKLVEGSTLNKDELMDYGKRVRLAGWHIKDVVVYDKPKELKELGATRAPQSWCYI